MDNAGLLLGGAIGPTPPIGNVWHPTLQARAWTTADIRASSLSCQNAGNAQKFAPVQGSYGNPGSEACELR